MRCSVAVWSPAACVILSALLVSFTHPNLRLSAILLSYFQKHNFSIPPLFNSLPLCSSLFSFPPSYTPPSLPFPKHCPTHTSNSFQADIQTFVDSHLETAFSSGWVSGSFHTSRLINLQASQARERAAGEVDGGGGGGGRTDRGDDGLVYRKGMKGEVETKENWALKLGRTESSITRFIRQSVLDSPDQ